MLCKLNIISDNSCLIIPVFVLINAMYKLIMLNTADYTVQFLPVSVYHCISAA